MYGHLHSYLVASVLGAVCCISGCGTQTDTMAAALYDPVGERYGRSVPNQDVAAEIASTTMSSEDVGAQAEASNESTNSNAAASAAPAPTLATSRNTDGAVIGAQSPTAESDALADNSGSALNARIAQLEELVSHLQAELRRGQAANGDSPAATRQQIDPIISAGSSGELVDGDVDGDVSDTAGSEPNRRGHTSSTTRYARMDLDRLITRYRRARAALKRSEASYEIDHFMSMIKLFELGVHNVPFTFGPLPAKDEFAFKDFQEAADELVPELELYLENLATEDEHTELRPLLDEAKQVTEMEPPTTGNRLMDFLQRLKEMDERHQSEQQ